jgi:hypothetical protein
MAEYGDPSIISGIQTPAQSQNQAATAAVNMLALKQQVQENQQQNALRQVLSAPDALDPQTGAPTTNTLAAIAKVSPDYYAKAIGLTGQAEERAAMANYRNEQAYTQKQKRAGEVMNAVVAAYDEELKAGKSPEDAWKAAQDIGVDIINDERTDEQSRTQSKQFLSTLDPAKARAYAAALKASAPTATTKGADIETLTDSRGNTYDHNKITGANKGVSGPDIETPGQDFTPEGKTTKIGGAGDAGGLDDEGVKYYAKEFRTYGPTSLGRLTKADRDKVINYAAGTAGGDSTGDIKTQYAGKGAQAEQRSEGTRTGQLRIAEEEMEGAVNLSQNAYDKLPRGQFTPFNELRNLYEKKTSSPEQAAAYTADNAIVNIYARMISPTGHGTDSDKNHAREMLNQAQGPEAHRAVLNQLMAEGKNALAKAQKARAETTEETPVAGGADRPAPKAASSPPVSLLKENVITHFKNGQAWTIRDGKAVRVSQ